jgi:hypothetical protein
MCWETANVDMQSDAAGDEDISRCGEQVESGCPFGRSLLRGEKGKGMGTVLVVWL